MNYLHRAWPHSVLLGFVVQFRLNRECLLLQFALQRAQQRHPASEPISADWISVTKICVRDVGSRRYFILLYNVPTLGCQATQKVCITMMVTCPPSQDIIPYCEIVVDASIFYTFYFCTFSERHVIVGA